MKVTLVSKILLGSLFVGSALGVTVTVNSTAAHTVPSTLCESSFVAYPLLCVLLTAYFFRRPDVRGSHSLRDTALPLAD